MTDPTTMQSGLNATDIAIKLNMDRSNVSRQLNVLYKAGHLIKFLGKSTLYLYRPSIVKAYPNAFFPTTIPKDKTIKDYTDSQDISSRLSISHDSSENVMDIKWDQSLQKAITQASAAIMYPPHGLHILITGNIGTGKLNFAKTMHQYSIEQHYLSANAPLVILDCREYQANPQALMVQLFGEGKSSKNRSHKGLLEKASGGIICLDGIQSINPILQKRMIKLLENHMYSRIGEADIERFNTSIIIGIANDSAQDLNFQTFARHFPVHIAIPDLADRAVKDIFNYITVFFQNQASIIGISFHVSINVIARLLTAVYPGNIEELKAVISAICSFAYYTHTTAHNNNTVIEVSENHLPEDLSLCTPPNLSMAAQVQEFLSGFKSNGITFSSDTLLYARQPFSIETVSANTSHNNSNMTGIPVFIILHGEGIAEKIADLINQECQNNIVIGFSFCNYTSLKELETTVNHHALISDKGNGILIFSDMEPLLGLNKSIYEATGINAEIVTAWSFSMLIPLCKAASATNCSVRDFITENLYQTIVEENNDYMSYVTKQLLAPGLVFLNPDKAVIVLLDTLKKILNDLSFSYSNDIAIKFVFHCSHMIERLIRDKPLKYDKLKNFITHHTNIFSIIEKNMQYPADSFGIAIPSSELAYITEIFIQ